MERCDDETDWAGVDVAKDVTADDLKRRTNVRARATADALQRLPKLGILPHSPPAIVDQYDVDLLWSVHANRERKLDVGASTRPGGKGDVHRHLLTGRAWREK